MLSRIEKIISENGLNAKQFAEILGVGNSKITDWRNGKTKPTLNDIIGISQKFHITTDYLIFGKESDSELTENETKLLDNFRELDSFTQGRVFEYIENLHSSSATKNIEEVREYDIPMVAFGSGTSSQKVKMTPSEFEKWIETLKKNTK